MKRLRIQLFFLLIINCLVIAGLSSSDLSDKKPIKKNSLANESTIIDLDSNKDYLNILIQELGDNDVLIIGEEHNDTRGHEITLKIFQELSNKYPLTLSLEMLEWNQQISTNEYLEGKISESAYLNDSKYWSNFQKDYFPLLKWAKENQIPVICANPPRKYANAIARQGLKAYKNFPEEPRLYPLPQNLLRDRNSIYESKLRDLFQGHGSHASVEHTILAQNFWDAGMTEKIASHQLITGRKVLHLNGRFHSDYGLGVAHRLKKSGIRTLTMTLLPKAIKTETERKIADFLIFTNKPILKEDGKSD